MRRPRLTKEVYEILSSLFCEAEADGFTTFVEGEPETFTPEAIQTTSDWLAAWSDRWTP